jgi:enoyl-CoA hydratase/carnithine racemase
VLVSAAGDNYSAGNDLQDFLDHPPGSGDSPQKQLIDALRVLDKPLVGAVRGAAVGSGATMLTYFDFVVVGQSARFQYPFINLALVPEFGTSFSLPDEVGYLRAAEIILLGHPFDAPTALNLGLVTKVLPDAEVLGSAEKSLKSWHRSHWLQSKLANNFCAVKHDPVSRRLSRTNWWSLAKEFVRPMLERRLPHSLRSGILDSIRNYILDPVELDRNPDPG